MEELKPYLVEDRLDELRSNESLEKHYDFALKMKADNEINKDNVEKVIEEAIGQIFLNVLKDAGVFKETEEGKAAFDKCRKKLLNLAVK